MTREQILQEAYNRGFEKAAFRGAATRFATKFLVPALSKVKSPAGKSLAAWLAAGAAGAGQTELEYSGKLLPGLVPAREVGLGQRAASSALNAVALRYLPGAFSRSSGAGPVANMKRLMTVLGVGLSTPALNAAIETRNVGANLGGTLADIAESANNVKGTTTQLQRFADGLEAFSKTRDIEAKAGKLIDKVNKGVDFVGNLPWKEIGYGAAGLGALYGGSKIVNSIRRTKEKEDAEEEKRRRNTWMSR